MLRMHFVLRAVPKQCVAGARSSGQASTSLDSKEPAAACARWSRHDSKRPRSARGERDQIIDKGGRAMGFNQRRKTPYPNPTGTFSLP